ncbi:hypothetical protein Q5530_12260 [Saccharothrix sp. BKS2]|uniref:hypothetical protein n=1 Tax=Saccharothrix sp. BKS2 TaxID=3064400 RepID=UPI0039E8B7D3
MHDADPELVAALAEPERVHTTLTRLGGKELTGQVTSWSVDRGYDTDLPAAMRAVNGSSSAELRLTLTGTGEQTAAQLYSPYAPHTTADLTRPRQSALHGWGLAGDALPAFRGSIRDRVADSATGLVDLSALDGAERLRDAATLPVAVSTGTTPISSGTWIVDHLLREAGIHSAPPPRPDAILYASMHGGFTPDIGFYRDHVSNSHSYSRARAPWEIAAVPASGSSPYTVRWDPRTRTTVPGSDLLVEAWVDARMVPAGGGQVQIALFYQADGATNHVRVWFDFSTDTVGVGTDSTSATIRPAELGRRGIYHVGAYWSFTDTRPTAYYYLSGEPVLGGFYERAMGERGPLPTGGSQLNYVELTSGMPVEAVQVSKRSGRPTRAEFDPTWTRGAVLDEVTSPLLAVPPTQGSAWEVITAVARAEQATAEFDEYGVFRYRNNRRFTNPGTPVLTVTSAREIASLRVSEAIDAVRNTIDVPYSTYRMGTTATKFSDTALRSLSPFGSFSMSIDYDVSEYDSPPPVVYATTAPTGSRVRFATQTSGTTGVHGAVETTAERDGNRLVLTFRNRTTSTLYLVTSTGSPSLVIASIGLASGSPIRNTVRRVNTTSRTLYGAQVYQVAATPWIQSSTTAGAIADHLLAVGALPLPILGDVEILPDPRIQLGDLVRVVDHIGATLSTPAWVVGIRTNGDDTGRVRQILTLRATTTAGAPTDTGLFPDPPIDPDAQNVLAREGVRVP